MYSTSAMAGRLVIFDLPTASKEAAINFSAEFFAPETFTVPTNLAPPTTLNLSIITYCNCLAPDKLTPNEKNPSKEHNRLPITLRRIENLRLVVTTQSCFGNF
jgi:hypothetical protein